MARHGIPTGRHRTCHTIDEAETALRSGEFEPPFVLKADGLAAGKGVIVAETTDQALEALSEIMEDRAFGDAGNQVLVEECLVGQEASLLCFADGETVVPIIPARDYKRARDNDSGPNTGGMGVYSPPGFLNSDLAARLTRFSSSGG